jgi:hypothetical protein
MNVAQQNLAPYMNAARTLVNNRFSGPMIRAWWRNGDLYKMLSDMEFGKELIHAIYDTLNDTSEGKKSVPPDVLEGDTTKELSSTSSKSKRKVNETTSNEAVDSKKIRFMLPTQQQTDNNYDTFPGFEEKGHVAVIGVSNSGKTKWTQIMLAKDKFAVDSSTRKSNYKQIWLLSQENTKEGAKTSLLLAAAYFTDIGLDYNDGRMQSFYYEHANDLNALNALVNTRQKEETLLIIDDISTSLEAQKKLNNEWLNKAKNSNITLVVLLHFQVDQAKTIRETARYLVYVQPNEHVLTTGTKITPMKAKQYIAKLSTLGFNEQVIIYDKLKVKFYYGTGEMKDFDEKDLNEIKTQI